MPTRSTPPAAATHPSLAASYRCGSSGSPAASLASTSVGPAPLDASKGRFFLDSYGRRVLLHGANVSGLDKLPTEPNGFTHLDMGEAYFDGANISFVGRPWPLEESCVQLSSLRLACCSRTSTLYDSSTADELSNSHEHLSRLRNWGLTFIRLVVPWEALEHRGPGEHDQAYIAYLHALISLLPQYGIRCYIDAHQDVWSRHAGGSGAPLWTLTLVGFDVRNLKATGAAHAHNLHLEPHDRRRTCGRAA